VIHGTPLAAVHPHPAPAVTFTVFLAPPAGTLWLGGDGSPIVHPLAWLTVNIWPPIVNVPDRAMLAVAAALYCTVPPPLPLAPDVTVSQDALLVAVHGHPAPVVTVTLPVPPAAGTLALVGAIEMEQPLPCVTVIVEPPKRIVPVLAGPVSAATAKPIAPVPLPVSAVVNVIHGTSLTAVHAQPGDVSIVAEPDPPWAEKD
jgi:hypothetical protein